MTTKDNPTYQLNGQVISRAEFEIFLHSLNGKDNWSCDETSDGGVTTYEAKDSGGRTYSVFLQSGGANKNIIKAK